MQGRFLFLGTGASTGIPIIGCHCKVCSSHSTRNFRLRSSGLIQYGNRSFLIDAGPDFRQMALLYHIEHLDGLLLTHTHYDHIAGIDELRVYNFTERRPIPCLLSKESFLELQKRYYYIFETGNLTQTVQLQVHVLDQDFGKTEFVGQPIEYFSFSQGETKVTGFRLGTFAYVTDIRDYSEDVVKSLQGVQKLVVSAIGLKPSHAHFSVDEAIQFSRKVGAQNTWLTHIAHHLDHDVIEKNLPTDIHMGYDGLEFSF